MTVPKLAKGDSLASFTVFAWINPEDSSSTFLSMKVNDVNIENHYMSYGYPGGFFYNTNYFAECQVLPLTSTCYGYSNSQKIDTLVKRWSHIVFWKDKDKMTSFFNGRKNYVSQSPKNVIVSLNHGGLVGSGYGYSPTGSYKGSVDDIRIYDRALTDEEIQKLFEEKP